MMNLVQFIKEKLRSVTAGVIGFYIRNKSSTYVFVSLHRCNNSSNHMNKNKPTNLPYFKYLNN